MTITLPPQLEKQVQKKVAAGEYDSPFDVLQDGLRLIEERDRKLEALRADVQLGVDQADRGEVAPLDMETLIRDLRAKHADPSLVK